MGKQGFEMAAQVYTADDILWTKFLLLLPKLLYVILSVSADSDACMLCAFQFKRAVIS